MARCINKWLCLLEMQINVNEFVIDFKIAKIKYIILW